MLYNFDRFFVALFVNYLVEDRWDFLAELWSPDDQRRRNITVEIRREPSDRYLKRGDYMRDSHQEKLPMTEFDEEYLSSWIHMSNVKHMQSTTGTSSTEWKLSPSFSIEPLGFEKGLTHSFISIFSTAIRPKHCDHCVRRHEDHLPV